MVAPHGGKIQKRKAKNPHLGFFLMSSNWPTTWDTFVRTILKAISSSPMISNLSNRKNVSRSNSKARQGEYLNFNTL